MTSDISAIISVLREVPDDQKDVPVSVNTLIKFLESADRMLYLKTKDDWCLVNSKPKPVE